MRPSVPFEQNGVANGVVIDAADQQRRPAFRNAGRHAARRRQRVAGEVHRYVLAARKPGAVGEIETHVFGEKITQRVEIARIEQIGVMPESRFLVVVDRPV